MAENSEENNEGLIKRLQNIEPHKWKKGQSGNPGGRPRKIISESYEKLGKLKCPDDPQGRTYGELLAAGQFEAAIRGDTRAAREITDRLEGKAVQAIFGPDNSPITIELLDRFLEEADEEDAQDSQHGLAKH